MRYVKNDRLYLWHQLAIFISIFLQVEINIYMYLYEKVSVSKNAFETDFSSEVRTFNYSKQNYEMAHSSHIITNIL